MDIRIDIRMASVPQTEINLQANSNLRLGISYQGHRVLGTTSTPSAQIACAPKSFGERDKFLKIDIFPQDDSQKFLDSEKIVDSFKWMNLTHATGIKSCSSVDIARTFVSISDIYAF